MAILLDPDSTTTAPAVQPAMVFLVWINDHLLGVYGSSRRAHVRLETERLRYPNEDWRQLPGGRWTAKGIARLEVEPRCVL